MVVNPILVPMTVSVDSVEIGMTVGASAVDIPISTNIAINVQLVPDYTGEYIVTPSQETQILAATGMRMTNDVTIDPIPSNYGLITWNGSIITVS